MKVKKRDINVYHLKLEHEDDLYHLNLLLDEGDMIRALTERREATQTDRIRKERGKKQKIKLTNKKYDRSGVDDTRMHKEGRSRTRSAV